MTQPVYKEHGEVHSTNPIFLLAPPSNTSLIVVNINPSLSHPTIKDFASIPLKMSSIDMLNIHYHIIFFIFVYICICRFVFVNKREQPLSGTDPCKPVNYPRLMPPLNPKPIVFRLHCFKSIKRGILLYSQLLF